MWRRLRRIWGRRVDEEEEKVEEKEVEDDDEGIGDEIKEKVE